ncbi:hypothetical protein ABEF95_001363 [Exophiala dermatitidis]
MEIPYRSFTRSHPFRFLIGPEKASIYIHSELVKQHSETLAALVGGGMSEAEKGCAHLEDIDEDTFNRFVEFAYTGDYSVPDPTFKPVSDNEDPSNSPGTPPNHEMEAPVEDEPTNFSWGFETKTTISGGRRKVRRNGWTESSTQGHISEPIPLMQEPGFGIERQPESQQWREFKDKAHIRERPAWEPRKNLRPNEDYEPVFMCHASLYIFSDRYSIEPLRELVLQKLRLTLSRFTLFAERTGDIVHLLKYTYANTMDHDSGIDTLRNLVTDYAVCEIEKMATDHEFQDYLTEEGFAAKDLMVKLVQRLGTKTKATRDEYYAMPEPEPAY